MHWSAEEVVLVVTGALLIVIVGASFLPKVTLSSMSRVTFAIGAAVFIGAAVALARLEEVRYPPLLWLLPLVPIIIIGVLVRDAIAWRSSAVSAPTGRSAPVSHADEPRRAAFFPPTDESFSAGEGGDGRALALVADPTASAQDLADIAFTMPGLRAAVAKNPATPANVLEWLASQNDPVVHAAIASRATLIR